MNPTDFAEAVHECLPTRPTRTDPVTGVRRSDEYGSAEIIAAELFRRDFEERHRGAQVLFTAQHEYLSTVVNNSPEIAFALAMMKEHFRNWVSPRNPAREGGFRKPDGLCIAARSHRVQVEVLEVKPVSDEAQGKKQMSEMLQKLRVGLADALQAGGGQGFGSDDFSFDSTEWRPSRSQLVCPLLNPRAGAELTWACFSAMARRARVEGLLLYELHSIHFTGAASASSRLPPDLCNRIRSAYENDSQTTSAAVTSWQENYCRVHPLDVRALSQVGRSADWPSLAAGLAVVLGRSKKAAAVSVAEVGKPRGLLESSSPLTVVLGSDTLYEPGIKEAVILANVVRRLG